LCKGRQLLKNFNLQLLILDFLCICMF